MREIKFRAWDKRDGLHKMYWNVSFIPYGEGWNGGNPDYKFYQIHHGVSNTGFFLSNMNEIELMQFTGLHDKNGKEVYEGDIVCCPHFPANGSMHYLYHQIMWDEKYTGWKAANLNNKDNQAILVHGNLQLWVYVKNEPECEVIGNIYENPEMC